MTITNFMSNFRGGARQNRFRVSITWPGAVGSPNVRDDIVCTAASMPSSIIGVTQVFYRGRAISIPGDRTFEEWTATFMNDVTYSHRNAFERWSNLILSQEGNVQGTENYKDMLVTIDIAQLGRDDSVLKTVRLFNAWPTNISSVELDYSSQDTVSNFTVNFNYSHWESANTTT